MTRPDGRFLISPAGRGVACALLAAAGLGALPARAENLRAADPGSVLAVMQSEGYLGNLTKDDVGDPMIESRVSDTEFSVYFYGCDNNTNCGSIELGAGYDLPDGMTAGKINEWNRENRFARAYVDDEGDPFLRFDIVMYGEGVSVATFAEALDLWRRQVEDFEKFIDW